MSFNTRPSTINEIAGFVDKRLTNAKNQLAATDPSNPNYEYLLERVEALEKNSANIKSMMGKKIPESSRDKWKKKLDKR